MFTFRGKSCRKVDTLLLKSPTRIGELWQMWRASIKTLGFGEIPLAGGALAGGATVGVITLTSCYAERGKAD